MKQYIKEQYDIATNEDYVIARWISGYDEPYFEDFHGTQNEAISYILAFEYGEEPGQIREAHVCDAHGVILYRNKLKQAQGQ